MLILDSFCRQTGTTFPPMESPFVSQLCNGGLQVAQSATSCLFQLGHSMCEATAIIYGMLWGQGGEKNKQKQTHSLVYSRQGHYISIKICLKPHFTNKMPFKIHSS